MGTARKLGPTGQLGRYAATHRQGVFLTCALIAVGLGLLAPRDETELSGAAWAANGSESVRARGQIQREFGGAGSYALQVAVHSSGAGASAPRLRRTVARGERVLDAPPGVGAATPSHPGASIPAEALPAIVVGPAARGPNEMVAAADRLRPEIAAVAGPGNEAEFSRAGGLWGGLKRA